MSVSLAGFAVRHLAGPGALVATGVRPRLGALVQYLATLQSPADLVRYARLRRRYARGDADRTPLPLRVRVLGGRTVWCRPSRDVFTFKYTFLSGFHLPPAALPPDATILDLGSNVGYTVAHLAHAYPDARVIGVEMDEENLALARRNTAAFGDRVQLIHAAAWTEDGSIAYSGEHDDAFHVNGADGGARSRSAPSLRIETILDRAGAARADYVKMDVEGAEAALITRGAGWLQRAGALKVEVHPPATVDGVRAVLEAEGFRTWLDAGHPRCVCAVK